MWFDTENRNLRRRGASGELGGGQGRSPPQKKILVYILYLKKNLVYFYM